MRPARDAYREAGVDIEAGDEVVDRISPHVRRTFRPGVLGDIGGFGGMFAVPAGFREPVLVSGTDGVGTKLLLAQACGRHDGIGIDLVAMCANDVAVCGAEPLFFLDYFATGRLDPAVAERVIAGIAEGCRQAGCALIGGETAEMPGMYGPGHYDLAGFCVGVVERSEIIDGRRVQAGDVLVGIASSGVHSNGYSLVRRLVEGLDLQADHGLPAPLADLLLEPTILYVKDILDWKKRYDIKGIIHITGGGFYGNIPRMIPAGLGAEVLRGSWPVPPLFGWLQARGGLTEEEMYRTFNNGIGLVLILSPGEAARLLGELSHDTSDVKDEVSALKPLRAWKIGQIVPDPENSVRMIDPPVGAGA